MEEDLAVTKFREYLRIKTVQPDPDYDTAILFLKAYAKELDLPVHCYQSCEEPVRWCVVVTWEGTRPDLPALLLNSHMDVVPVYAEHWKHEPFSADKEPNGDIYARGSQDMKCVTIQYLEAIRRLKASGRQLERTIHLSFVPDEEIHIHSGLEPFCKTDDFKNLNIGFGMDEGLANPTEAFTVFYGERSVWWIHITASGHPGHGSRFIEDNVGEKIRKVINSFLAYRDSEEQRMKNNDLLLGDVTTVNLTGLSGGIATNVVPTEFKATFDIRITPTVDLTEFERMIKKWCNEAGPGITYQFEQKFVGTNITPLSDDNPWWHAFTTACKHLDMKIETEIFPAATDSRFLRSAGYQCVGFSPMNKTPILLHDHNEFLNEGVFLRGVEIYEKLISSLASIPA